MVKWDRLIKFEAEYGYYCAAWLKYTLLLSAVVLIGMKLGNFPGSGIRNKQVSDIESGYPDIESGYPDIRI